MPISRCSSNSGTSTEDNDKSSKNMDFERLPSRHRPPRRTFQRVLYVAKEVLLDAAELDALERLVLCRRVAWHGEIARSSDRVLVSFWVGSEQLACEREVAAELELRAGASALHVFTRCQGVFESLLDGVCA